jgi:hypothetical protein
MIRKRRELAERLAHIEDELDRIGRAIDKIEVATIVRDPSSALSAEAYDGLRRQIVAAAGERTAHLYQLAVFAQVADRFGGELAPLVREWMEQSALVRVEHYDERCVDVLGGNGSDYRMVRPAFVDGVTGRPIIMGQAERVTLPRTEEVPR